VQRLVAGSAETRTPHPLIMLDGLVAARSLGEARLTVEERAGLDGIIDATRRALIR